MVWLAAAGAVAQSSDSGVDYARRTLKKLGITPVTMDWSETPSFISRGQLSVFDIGSWTFQVNQKQDDMLMVWRGDEKSLANASSVSGPVRTEEDAGKVATTIAKRLGWSEGVDYELETESESDWLAASLRLSDLDGFERFQRRLSMSWDKRSGHLIGLQWKGETDFIYGRPLFIIPMRSAAELAHREFERQRREFGGSPTGSVSELILSAERYWAVPSSDYTIRLQPAAPRENRRPIMAPLYIFTQHGHQVIINAGTGQVLDAPKLMPDGTLLTVTNGAFNPPLALASMLATLGLGGAGLFWWSRRRRRAKTMRVP